MTTVLTIAILIVGTGLLTFFLVIGWQLDHDTKPRNPYDE